MIHLPGGHTGHADSEKGNSARLKGELALAIQSQDAPLALELHLTGEIRSILKDTELGTESETAESLDPFGNADKETALLFREKLEGMARGGRVVVAELQFDRL